MGGQESDYFSKLQKLHKRILIRRIAMSMVCVLAAFATLYGLRKPASAISEDKADGIGLFVDAGDLILEDYVEEVSADPVPDPSLDESDLEEPPTEELVLGNDPSYEDASGTLTEEDLLTADAGEIPDSDGDSKEGAETSDAQKDETAGSASGESSSEEDTEGTASDETAEEETPSDEETSEETSAQEINLADYITETIILRANADGSYTQISEDEIREGDHLRVTVRYTLPETASEEDHLIYDVPDEFGTVTEGSGTLDDGRGSYQISPDGQIIIEYKEVNISWNRQQETSYQVCLQSEPGIFLAEIQGEVLLPTYLASGSTGSLTYETTVKVASSTNANAYVITGVSAQYSPYWYDDWKDLVPRTPIADNSRIRFSLSYRVPQGMLDASTVEGRSITYDLSAVGITPLKAVADGLVYNSAGVNVGTYTVTADGLVTIVFYEEFARKNAYSEIDGDFNFTCLGSRDQGQDSKTYYFSDEVSYTVYFTDESKDSLEVEKNYEDASYNAGTGKMTYVVYVSSPLGTTGKVTLKDVMTVRNYAGQTDSSKTALISLNNVSVSITDANTGSRINGTSITKSGNSFVMEIPQMAAGSKYKITYTITVPQDIRESMSVTYLNNAVTASYDGSSDHTDGFDYTFENQPEVKKSGTKTGDHQITWTITVNPSGKNLKGYTLVDKQLKLNQDVTWQKDYIPLTGKSVTMKSSSGQSFTATLPYTFTKDDYNTYVVTYTEEYDATDLIYGNVTNAAYLLLDPDDDDSGDSTEGSVYVGDEDGDMVHKEASYPMLSDTSDPSNQLVTIPWTVTLIAPIKRNENNNTSWTYTDAMEGNQIITSDELSKIQKSLRSAFDSTCVVSPVGDSVSSGSKTGYRSFTVTFHKDLTSSIGNISFSYETIGNIKDASAETAFSNTGWVYSKNYTSTDSTSYYPLLTKYDGTMSRETQTYDYYSSLLHGQGIIPWILRLYVPEGYDGGPITIYENLPDTVTLIDNGTYGSETLYGVQLSTDASFSGASGVTFNGDTGTGQILGAQVTVTKASDGTFTILLPQEAINKIMGKNLYIRVLAKVKDDVKFPADSYILFTNEAKVSNPGGEIGGDIQSQKITRIDNFVSKTAAPVEGLDALKYVVEINESSADLSNDSDELTLTDVLKAQYGWGDSDTYPDDYEGRVDLLPESVAVYQVDRDGNKTELDPSRYSMHTDTVFVRTGYYPRYTEYEYIYMTVPDEMHLIIEYTYSMKGETGYKLQMSNKITLEGTIAGGTEDEHETEYQIQNTSAHANVKGITVYKVDEDNENLHLPGASFKLEVFNGRDFEEVKNPNGDSVFLTDEEDKVRLDDLTPNTAYRLTEVSPPDGYMLNDTPAYFLLAISGEEHYEDPVIPEQFTALGGVRLSQGQNLYMKDRKILTWIKVNKLWAGEEGDKSSRPTSIYVTIGRRLGDGSDVNHTHYYSTYILQMDQQGLLEKLTNYPSLEYGTVINLTFEYSSKWNTAPPSVKANGVAVVPNEATSDQEGPERLTYTIPITGHTQIVTQNITYTTYSLTGITVKEPEKVTTGIGVPVEEETSSYMTLELHEASDGTWSATLDQLDKYCEARDENGNLTGLYQWLYYVSEYSSLYYTPTYSDNNLVGINEGELTITNTRNEIEQYVLPKTGGEGKKQYLFIALGLILIAVIGLKGKKTKP